MEKNKKIFLGIGISVLVIGLLIATMFIGPKEELESVLSDDPNVIFENAERESASIKESQMKKIREKSVLIFFIFYNCTNLKFSSKNTKCVWNSKVG